MNQPYVYKIESKDGHIYYGCRHAKNCHPKELWVKYFTSSKVVQSLISQHGPDYFTHEVIMLCQDGEEALQVEAQLIESVHTNPLCLNRFHVKKDGSLVYFGRTGPLSEEAKAHLSNVTRGKNKPIGFSETSRQAQIKYQASVRIWNRPRAKPLQHVWAMADQFYQLWKNEGWGHERFCNRMNDGNNIRVFYNMYKMFKYENWVPMEDSEWVKDFM
ncbi:hypothetical protein [Salmonella phage S115]|uniref:GIY-YIG homing endonuclease n=4 Tax=Kuttervirus TaxID=2169536 RepID=A0A1W5PUZ3_9CAUD|nr:hypothetical protein BI169_gp029 [Salmonella phage GG32]YP_009880709.1 hypothetical protein HYP66_gp142 [Salmonella phage S118]YP_009887365.1 hypothetical protein HYQ29_gp028 [Salmonella phage rabagast]APD18450.1 GIY-YIG homing endonuclease [Salmonella phage STP07]AXC40492.1 hypothetical protein [Salmonella phage S115]AXF41714.1 GIY-YIG homing endonuclease [Salmonella phage vB_SalM-LPST94]ANN86030.1 hypothetical protein [Salmonella phage GG32]AXC41059.1 hypothetical protein [Salmonella ph